jgi:hypothetical protein
VPGQNPPPQLVVAFLVTNGGFSSSANDAHWLTDQISDIAGAIIDSFTRVGGTIGNKIMHWLRDPLYADCDGAVALDSFTLTGDDLDAGTLNANVASDVRQYPGPLDPNSDEYKSIYKSSDGCGATSNYTIT